MFLKSTRAFSVMLACVQFLICGCSKEQNYQSEIVQVYRQINNAYSVWQQEEKAHDGPFDSGMATKYINTISGIDTSRCPPDFQEAFLAYLNAERTRTASLESTRGFVNFTTSILTLKGLNPAEYAKAKQGMAVLNNAVNNMKAVAAKYGVQFK